MTCFFIGLCARSLESSHKGVFLLDSQDFISVKSYRDFLLVGSEDSSVSIK